MSKGKNQTSQIGTVNITPTWSAIVPVLIAVLEDGTPEGKKMAKEEIQRMAMLLDLINAERKLEKANG